MRKEFYITTPIFYVNDKPHIGHAYTSLAVDVIARFRRAEGDEVFYLTGTDEHGVKILRSAQKAKKEPQKFADEIADKFKELKNTLNLSWDYFIRTTDKKKHWLGAQSLWKKLEESGDIYEKEYQGLYCIGCEAFINERDLDGGLCPSHKAKPEVIKEKNLFFRLSRYQDRIREAIESGELDIQPVTRRNEILSLIKNGLEDVSFSRPKEKLEWGIPVPGREDQTMYVWCDALSNYISAVGYGQNEKEFKKWWPADIHIIGKDILRFHAAIWPGMLLAANLPLPKHIFVHGFITIEGEKMSKTIGNVIDPNDLVKKYGSDAFRYYLLREIPSHEDGDFSVEKFEERYTADLANGLGNFASRTSVLALQNDQWGDRELSKEIGKVVEETIEKAAKAAEKFRLHETTAAIWDLIKFGDEYINDHKPWESKDQQVISNAINLLKSIAQLAEPIVPKAAFKIKEGINKKQKIENLFPRLDA